MEVILEFYKWNSNSLYMYVQNTSIKNHNYQTSLKFQNT